MPRVATKLTQKADGGWSARKRIPADARKEYARLYGTSAEVRFTTVAGINRKEAQRQWHEWSAEVEGRFASIRAAMRGEGIVISLGEARALSGEWYLWFTGKHGTNAPLGAHWDECRDVIQAELVQHAVPSTHPDLIWEQESSAREAVRPMLADFGETAQFLAAKGIALSAAARELFLNCLYPDLAAALSLLIRRSEGDYSPDKYPERFPRLQLNTGISAFELFEKWIEERKPANSSVDRWRGVFLDLKRHFGATRPIGSVLPEEAQVWTNGLVNSQRQASTVRDVWISAARTVCTWGVHAKHIARDPFASVHVTVPKKSTERESKAFTDDETQIILSAALAINDTRTPANAAKRWVPWLCAYTGARGGEITQLRGTDAIVRDGVNALRITPEAGTVKTRNARTVPLHEHLVAQGFLAYAKSKGSEPLFFNRPTAKHTDDPTNPRKARYVKTRERVAEWVRSLGVSDPELQPNHAWRHTFKQIADRVGIQEKISDVITGHVPLTVARGYGAPTLKDLAVALKKFPRFDVRAERAAVVTKSKHKRRKR